MLDRLDHFGGERLDQQRLRLLFRNAAGHQIEFELVVERAGGGAVAALDVVGKDLELRLAVGLRAVGQQQRARHHLGVGLLRLRPNRDLALKHGAGLVVDHRLEDFTALAAGGGVVDGERGIGMLPVGQQAQAAKVRFGAFAREQHELLIAHDGAAGREDPVH